MPKRVLTRYATWVGEHRDGLLSFLLVLSTLLALLAALGWAEARGVKQTQRETQAAQQAREDTANVVTCFSTARTRPRLIAVLNGLAGIEADPIYRDAISVLIDDYEDLQVSGVQGEPTREKCVELADMLGVPYAAYDFDPTSGRLLQSIGR